MSEANFPNNDGNAEVKFRSLAKNQNSGYTVEARFVANKHIWTVTKYFMNMFIPCKYTKKEIKITFLQRKNVWFQELDSICTQGTRRPIDFDQSILLHL